MSDPHSPKFIIALCEAATIKPSAPHHNTHHCSHTMKYISESLRYNIYLVTLTFHVKVPK